MSSFFKVVISLPYKLILPFDGSKKPDIKLHKVDLPQPVPPIIPKD